MNELNEIDEIKKDLYKEKPSAKLLKIVKGVMYYRAHVLGNAYDVNFAVPISDIGDATFYPEMSSQQLIRYIVD